MAASVVEAIRSHALPELCNARLVQRYGHRPLKPETPVRLRYRVRGPPPPVQTGGAQKLWTTLRRAESSTRNVRQPVWPVACQAIEAGSIPVHSASGRSSGSL